MFHFLGDFRSLTRWQLSLTMILAVSEADLNGPWRSEIKYSYLHRKLFSQWTIYQDHIYVLIKTMNKSYLNICLWKPLDICCLYNNKKLYFKILPIKKTLRSLWKTIKKTSVQKCEMQSFNWEEYVLSVIFGVYAFVSFSTFTVCYEYFSHFTHWLSHLFLNNSLITSLWKATCLRL